MAGGWKYLTTSWPKVGIFRRRRMRRLRGTVGLEGGFFERFCFELTGGLDGGFFEALCLELTGGLEGALFDPFCLEVFIVLELGYNTALLKKCRSEWPKGFE